MRILRRSGRFCFGRAMRPANVARGAASALLGACVAAWLVAARPFPMPVAAEAADDTASLLIAEVMVDPREVDDEVGEWIELFNAGQEPVNLLSYVLATHDREHVIDRDLWINPGQAVVLGVDGNRALNGGLSVDYVYDQLRLRNQNGNLILYTAGMVAVDHVSWGDGTGISAPEGASLERQGSDVHAPWGAATSSWPGSAGDLGSPGLLYSLPAPTATPEPSATPEPIVPPPAEAPRLLLSEVMANPAAVPDEAGEWLEIYNADSAAVNLRGWTLADLDGEQAVIVDDLWVQPGEYVVLGRNADPSTNGGLVVRSVYTGLRLANEADELILFTPWGAEADRLLWGDGQGLRIVQGASLERTGFDAGATWVVAAQSWPGSSGDRGSPNMPYSPPALPTPAPTLPVVWEPAPQPPALVIDEVNYLSADQEYIVLANAGTADADLTGWSLGDAETPGDGEGMHALPDGHRLAPGQVFVVARNGSAFRAQWGRDPDAEIEESDAAIPNLPKRRELASGVLALNDDGDEVILLDPALRVADAMAYRQGEYAALGLAGNLRAAAGQSLQRVPGFRYPATADVRLRFMAGAPQPFDVRPLPAPSTGDRPTVGDGLIALWGTLGASSNFSAEGVAPPHYLAAAASADGLDFVAVADPAIIHVDAIAAGVQAPIINVPAWQWGNADGARAVVYGSHIAEFATWGDLGGFLAATGYPAQAQVTEPPALAGLAAVGADDAAAPGGLASLCRGWRAAGRSLLPAGNAPPVIDGFRRPAARYTGLAVRQADLAGVMEALAAHRGWLTSAPGLRLTLRVRDGPWMGGAVQPANDLHLEIVFSDRSGEPAGLALWQDDKLVRQLDTPPAGGRWEVAVPALPGSFLYAVATELDGDFAVTAPIRVEHAAGGRVMLNEALPAPRSDLNGDGSANSDDEFVELYNAGDAPVGLDGWRLTDRSGDEAGGRQFVFGSDRYVPAHGYLTLWRGETRLSLNDDGDRIRLLTPAGEEADALQWERAPGDGRSLARLPDGGVWTSGAEASPGAYNRMPNGKTSPPKPPDPATDGTSTKETVVQKIEQGEAPGAPGSLAAAKLFGLGVGVEFRAQVVAPPELFNSAVYVAEPADASSGVAGLGVQVYLRSGVFMPMAEGDWVLVRGRLTSFRGELEVMVDQPDHVWRYAAGAPLLPLPVAACDVGESLEGRLVTFEGVVTGWQGDSIYLCDPAAPEAEVRVTVRSSLDWKRPYVNKGERWRVTGIVSQFAREHPWNGGYRVLVRYPPDMVRVEEQ